MKIKTYTEPSSPALFGLVLLLLFISGCQSNTPEQVSANFWQAIIDNQLATAQQLSTGNSQAQLQTQPHPEFQNATVETGQIIINKTDASVETILLLKTAKEQKLSFKTYLIKEQENWKVDYPLTQQQLVKNPFNQFFKSLEKLGDSFNQQLEKQIPLIEKEVQSLGDKLEQQIEKFSNELDKAKQPKTPHQDSI